MSRRSLESLLLAATEKYSQINFVAQMNGDMGLFCTRYGSFHDLVFSEASIREVLEKALAMEENPDGH